MEPLLLLHGALGNKDQFDTVVPKLKDHFEIHRLNFEGHGEAGPTDSPFRVEYFTENVLGYLDEHNIKKTNVFGYSIGGYIALNLAKEQPESIDRIATLGTILQWDEEVAQEECRYLYPDKIKENVPHLGKQLEKRHLSGWERVVDRTRDMLQYLGTHPLLKGEDWRNIKHIVRFHVGDRDATAGINDTMEVYKKMDFGELAVLPRTAHPISEVNMQVLAASLLDFFTGIKKPDPDERTRKMNGHGTKGND